MYLKPRDLRKVDPQFANRLEPLILVRCGCIALSLGGVGSALRAIITHKALYLLVPESSDLSKSDYLEWQVQAQVQYLLRGDAGEHGPVPFEFAALEALLLVTCREQQKRQVELTERGTKALLSLRRSVVGTQVDAGSSQLEVVRELKQQVRELLVQAQALESALEKVLQEDEDMAAMYLTRAHLMAGTPNLDGAANLQDHEEIETMLESYLQEVGATVGELEVLGYGIDATEKFVEFHLDSARNRLLKVDVLATLLGTTLGLGSVVSGIFGMNLQSSAFDADKKDWLFGIVVGVTVGIILCIMVGVSCFLFAPQGRFGFNRQRAPKSLALRTAPSPIPSHYAELAKSREASKIPALVISSSTTTLFGADASGAKKGKCNGSARRRKASQCGGEKPAGMLKAASEVSRSSVAEGASIARDTGSKVHQGDAQRSASAEPGRVHAVSSRQGFPPPLVLDVPEASRQRSCSNDAAEEASAGSSSAAHQYSFSERSRSCSDNVSGCRGSAAQLRCHTWDSGGGPAASGASGDSLPGFAVSRSPALATPAASSLPRIHSHPTFDGLHRQSGSRDHHVRSHSSVSDPEDAHEP